MNRVFFFFFFFDVMVPTSAEDSGSLKVKVPAE